MEHIASMEAKTSVRGGARAGAGRKKLGNAMLHTALNADYLARLMELAQWEGLTVVAWLIKHLTMILWVG